MKTKDDVQSKFLTDAITKNMNLKDFAQESSKKFSVKDCEDLINDFFSSYRNNIYNQAHIKMNDEYIDSTDIEKRIDVSNDSPIFIKLKSAIDKYTMSNIKLDSLVMVKSEFSEDYYVGLIYGGLNGNGKWSTYMDNLNMITKELSYNGDFWILQIDSDIADDTFYALFGYREVGV